jgi:hypothetical protein
MDADTSISSTHWVSFPRGPHKLLSLHPLLLSDDCSGPGPGPSLLAFGGQLPAQSAPEGVRLKRLSALCQACHFSARGSRCAGTAQSAPEGVRLSPLAPRTAVLCLRPGPLWSTFRSACVRAMSRRCLDVRASPRQAQRSVLPLVAVATSGKYVVPVGTSLVLRCRCGRHRRRVTTGPDRRYMLQVV